MQITTAYIKELNQKHANILGGALSTLEEGIELGGMLSKTKESIPHGHWKKWVLSNLDFTYETANNYIKCWDFRGAIHAKKVGGITEAYKLLASPKSAEKTSNVRKKGKNETNSIFDTNRANSPKTPEEQAEEDIRQASNPEQNGAPEQVYLDETGIEVPKEIVAVWKRGDEVQKLLTAISTVKGALEKAQKENDPLFRPCTSINTGGQAQSWATLICGLKDAYHAIKQAKPYAVCPSCGGKLSKTCTQCHNRGIVSEHFWKTYTSKETKGIREKQASQLRA